MMRWLSVCLPLSYLPSISFGCSPLPHFFLPLFFSFFLPLLFYFSLSLSSLFFFLSLFSSSCSSSCSSSSSSSRIGAADVLVMPEQSRGVFQQRDGHACELDAAGGAGQQRSDRHEQQHRCRLVLSAGRDPGGVPRRGSICQPGDMQLLRCRAGGLPLGGRWAGQLLSHRPPALHQRAKHLRRLPAGHGGRARHWQLGLRPRHNTAHAGVSPGHLRHPAGCQHNPENPISRCHCHRQ
jgi:hypothetical protein